MQHQVVSFPHQSFFVLVFQDPEDRLPPGMRQRAEALIIKILRYAYKMLIWSEDSALPAELRSNITKDSQLDLYSTMLLNDEVHTYDQVSVLSASRLLFTTTNHIYQCKKSLISARIQSCLIMNPYTLGCVTSKGFV